MVGDPFSFLFQTFNQNFNEKTILETHSMPEKTWKVILNISGNVNAAARLAGGQSLILK